MDLMICWYDRETREAEKREGKEGEESKGDEGGNEVERKLKRCRTMS